MKNLTKKIVSATLLALPVIGLAQEFPGLNVPQTGIRDLPGINRVIATVVNWVTGLFFVVAILFLFYAAYLYLGAAGDPERLTKAKDQLVYSVVAIAVALLAGSIRYIVANLLG